MDNFSVQRFAFFTIALLVCLSGAISPGWSQEEPTAPVANAVLEGIQISSADGSQPSEKVITGYFIFRDKPSSYFYEVKPKEKMIVFEFHDAEKGSSPIPSVVEDPVLGFNIEQRKIDVNKEMTGLNPEFHDVITITFKLRKVPILTVNDEFNVISFSYKWTTDPLKVAQYMAKEDRSMYWVWGGIGGGAVVAAAAVFFLIPKPTETAGGPIPTDDLPVHESIQP